MSAVASSILIVEDESVVALDLRLQLEEWGYDVVGIADTGLQALEMAREHRPSLTLMDIVLKGDRDGVSTAQDMQGELGLPVVFLTSFSDLETVRRAAQAAAYGYVTKPFQRNELRAGIEVALWKSQMERRLRESERWFASTLNCVHDGVIAVDAQGAVRLINPAAERLLGWSNDQAIGRPIDEVVVFDDEDRISAVHLALAESRVIGVRHGRRLKMGQVAGLPVDESAGPIADQRSALGAVLVLRDASERLRSEALLRASHERFRSAFEHAPLGMAVVSQDGHFLQVNDALCRLLGREPDWLLRQSQTQMTVPADRRHEEERLRELQDSGRQVTQFEKRYVRPFLAEEVWVLVHVSRLDQDGGAGSYLYQVHDLTAQREAAAQLAELAAERMRREASEMAGRSRQEFLSRMSHEMRTPLNAVLGFAQLLKAYQDGGRPVPTGYPEHILDAGRHLLALVDDVLDLQRAADGALRLQIEALPLDALVASTLDLLLPLSEPRGITVVREIEPGLVVRGDQTRVRQVLLNVGSNAVKYNAQGGTITVRASRVDTGGVRVSIRDTGIGMSQAQLEHLFEPFNRLGRESLRVPGVGLGLVISRNLMTAMEGRLVVTSSEGAGTLVTLEFP